MKKIVPERVRERRDAKGWSQSELAAEVDRLGYGPLSYQAIQQLEEGSTKKPKYAIYLPSALNTSWEYLTGQTDNPAAPGSVFVSEMARLSGVDRTVRPQVGVGQEGSQVLTEISRMLGSVEGSLKTAFNMRFDTIDKKLDDHERRLEALEESKNPIIYLTPQG
jgi:transcriptional regulator with XRE-family HTH domain